MSGPRYVGWIAIMLSVGALAACGQNPQTARTEAARLAAAGDLQGALLQLKSAAQRTPDDASLRAALGALYNARFDATNAVKELTRARELGLAREPGVALSLAQALRRQGQFAELLKRVPVLDEWPAPARGEVRALRGRAAHALGDPAAAAASLMLARREAPAGLEVALLAAQIRAGKQDFTGALAEVDGLLKRAPAHYDARVYRAVLLRAGGRSEDAIKAWGEVLALNRRDFTALLLRSRLLLAQDQIAAAAADAERLREEYPGQPAALVQHGVVALVEGEPRVALDDAQAALQAAPTLFSAMLLAGLSHHALGADSQAAEMFKACLAARPEHALARRSYVETLLRLNQPASALQVAHAGLSSGEVDPQLLGMAAEAHLALNEKPEADALLARAAALRPRDAGIQIRRALATLGAGEETRGLGELASAVQLADGATPADELLVVRLLRAGDLAAAARAIAALELRAPDSALTHNLRGLLAGQRGDGAAARQSFASALQIAPGFLPAAINLAHLELTRGDVAAARASYRAVVAAAPGALAPLLALADFEREQGDRAAAREAYAAALERMPKSLPAHLGLIALALAAQDATAAGAAAEAALAQLPEERSLLLVAARALRLANQPQRVAEVLRHFLALEPRTPLAWLEVAQFYRSVGETAAADRSLREGLQIAPTFAPLQVAWVASLLAQRRLEEARAYVHELQQRQAAAPIGWLLAGEMATQAGRHAEAQAAYEQALALQPVGQIAWKRFTAAARTGQAAAARRALLDWAAAHPEDRYLQVRLGDLALGQGDTAGAIAHYERVLASDPQSAEVLNNLAWACFLAGDARARNFAEAALRAAPDSPLALDTLGWILLAAQDTARGLALLRAAVARAPADPDIRYHYAAALAAIGSAPAARAELALALAAGPAFASRKDAEALAARLR